MLNKDYASTDRSFVLKTTTRTTNANWFNNAGPGNSQQTAMKNALRQGLKDTLNVYSVGYVKIKPIQWSLSQIYINATASHHPSPTLSLASPPSHQTTLPLQKTMASASPLFPFTTNTNLTNLQSSSTQASQEVQLRTSTSDAP